MSLFHPSYTLFLAVFLYFFTSCCCLPPSSPPPQFPTAYSIQYNRTNGPANPNPTDSGMNYYRQQSALVHLIQQPAFTLVWGCTPFWVTAFFLNSMGCHYYCKSGYQCGAKTCNVCNTGDFFGDLPQAILSGSCTSGGKTGNLWVNEYIGLGYRIEYCIGDGNMPLYHRTTVYNVLYAYDEVMAWDPTNPDDKYFQPTDSCLC